MVPYPNLIKPGIADEKAGKIIYEETYNPGENIDDVLGIGFLK